MAPITAPNAKTMIDVGLVPSSTYQYKIRAVGNAGRSNYTPSASNQFLVVVTSGDTQIPTVPQNLTAEATGIREIKLQWNASTDNTGIKEYQIYYGSQVIATGAPVTTYKLTNLPLNSNFTFTVRAKDLGNNLSAASSPAPANTFVNGLFYEHSTGAYSDIDLINWSIAEYEGKVDNFTLSVRTQEDYYNFQFEGYLYINTAGSYQFQTTSDDGSRVTIDNVLAVDNDGQHTPRTVSGTARSLSSGAHTINVKYFDYNGTQSLVVRYKGPDTNNSWLAIPAAALRSGASNMMAYDAGAAESLMSESDSADSEKMMVDVYPNPSRSNDNLTLQLTGTQEPVSVKLMDMMGKSFYENTLTIESLETGIQIAPREQLPRGIYILIVRQGNKTRKQTLMVND